MGSTELLALWFMALTLNPQTTQDCSGDCQTGYRSVCVQRTDKCNCTCVKDVGAGTNALRGLLGAYNVSTATIDEAVQRYREIAGGTTGEFSFTVSDGEGSWTIRGQGLLGMGNDSVVITSSRQYRSSGKMAARLSVSHPLRREKRLVKLHRRKQTRGVRRGARRLHLPRAKVTSLKRREGSGLRSLTFVSSGVSGYIAVRLIQNKRSLFAGAMVASLLTVD